MPNPNVVITGLGVVSPIGIGCEAFFESLLAGNSGIRSLAERTDGHATPVPDDRPPGIWIGGPVLDFDPKQYVRPRKALKVMCREIQMSFAASQLAIEHAGLNDTLPGTDEGPFRPKDIGTVFGAEMYYGPPTEMEDAIRHCTRPDGTVDGAVFGTYAMKDIMPLWMLKYLPNMPACHVGIAINAHGPNNTQVVGDVSGTNAMMEADSCLRRGIAKLMLCGAAGTRINTTRMNYSGDLAIPEVSDPLSNSSRPLDPSATGVVGGEGAVTMTMEFEDDARQRGAATIATVRSCVSRFVASDAMRKNRRHITDEGTRGSADAVRIAIDDAIAAAGMKPKEIGMVVSHAMGDRAIDEAERTALSQTLPGVPVVAPIGAIGHTGAASGSFGVLVGAMSAQRRVVPPTINAGSTGGLCLAKSQPLSGEGVLCLSHTPEGNAVAIVLS